MKYNFQKELRVIKSRCCSLWSQEIQFLTDCLHSDETVCKFGLVCCYTIIIQAEKIENCERADKVVRCS